MNSFYDNDNKNMVLESHEVTPTVVEDEVMKEELVVILNIEVKIKVREVQDKVQNNNHSSWQVISVHVIETTEMADVLPVDKFVTTAKRENTLTIACKSWSSDKVQQSETNQEPTEPTPLYIKPSSGNNSGWCRWENLLVDHETMQRPHGAVDNGVAYQRY